MSGKRKRQVLEGVVTGYKANKTISVQVPMMVKHPKYKKYMRQDSLYHAHDEHNEAKEGDRVAIVAARPISKTKHWRLVKVLEKAKTV
jgi:small subunit ribosomal protein S17